MKWKPVIRYEDCYEVSNTGKVRSLDRQVKAGRHSCTRLEKGRAMKLFIWGRYLYVVLRKNGLQRTESVHRMVAVAFLPNPLGLPEVNHKDSAQLHNVVSNLEWCSKKKNIEHAVRRKGGFHNGTM